ncbi:MAG: hypothetical protein EPN74_15170 [Rhodanobacter sp.]|nr:MAG: hypothetical protein EPN74_15170 [Rhodanobacter sp.]
MRLSRLCLLALSVSLITLSGCASSNLKPIQPVAKVDLNRFMGRWYVIASIPSFLENEAYNATETYRITPKGTIATTFRYHNNAFSNPVKTIHSTGFVRPDTGNAVWGIQIIWPIKAQYLVAYLNKDYSQTIIARDKRDYVWVMARTPTLSPADYDALMGRVKKLGYDMSGMRKVPQQWPEKNP